jgi:hypothetical protein
LTYKLNREQQLLFDKTTNLAFSKLLVLGEGGSGKSFCLCKAISELARKNFFNMVVCAPTHLARLNIMNKLDSDVRHLVETCTVASLLMKFGIESEDGTVQFTPGKLDKINKYALVVLDECSMISDADYKMLMNSKAKIIFSGDFSQLPPVMAKSAEKAMEGHVITGNLEVIHLFEQMRQQGVIHAAAERNRESVWFPDKDEQGEGGESIKVHANKESLIRTMIGSMKRDERGYEATHYHRYITYKNSEVRSVGKRVRDEVLNDVFGFDASSFPFICKELIMMRENRGTIGYNGELVEVQDVKKEPADFNYPWESYELLVSGSIGTGLIRTIPPCSYKDYDDYMKDLQSKLHSHQIRKDVESANKVLKQIKRIRSRWTMTQYPYAVSTHKSQGMTIENVYLDTEAFVSAPNKRALLYVGISRASDTLHTIKVSEEMALDGKRVNDRYRAARAQFELVSGQPYQKIVRGLNISTRTLQGKEIVAGYLECLVEDLRQGK